jgi:hypothetical protein
LVTSYSGGNANFGEGFSIAATTGINFSGLSINPQAAGAVYSSLSLYEALGPANVGDPINFTLVAQSTSFTAGAANAPTVVPITFNVPIAAGSTDVFYIAVTDSRHSLAFTDGGAFGTTLAQAANISVLEAMTGGATPPTIVADTNRQFNGTISYSLAAVPEPGTLGLLGGAAALLAIVYSGCTLRRAKL